MQDLDRLTKELHKAGHFCIGRGFTTVPAGLARTSCAQGYALP